MVQGKANDSEHFAVSGDCGYAEAGKKTDGSYSFKLAHKAAYLMFEPKVEAMPNTNYCKIKHIVITELDGKNIAGTYTFSSDGLQLESVQDGGSTITLVCGDDVEEGNSYAEFANSGFPLSTEIDPDNNRAFVVIQPNKNGESYRLKVDYTLAYCVVQTATHDTTNPDVTNEQYWKMSYKEETYTCSKEFNPTFKENYFYRIQHTLTTKNISNMPEYEFEQYYMWGAKDWFWSGVSKYPTMNEESQAENQPTEGSDRWYDNKYNKATSYSVVKDMYGTRNEGTYFAWESSNVSKYYGEQYIHRQTQSNSLWTNSLTANQMSFYVVYGDAHLDTETEWILNGYNGTKTICTGGVWLLKKEYFDLPDGVSYPTGNDGATFGTDLSAPFPGDECLDAYISDGWAHSYARAQKGYRWNLRYYAPRINYRMPYKQGKPAASEIDKYFFLPMLGRISYDWKDENKQQNNLPTMTLVGGQGFYWTKTPLQGNDGGTKFGYIQPVDPSNSGNAVGDHEHDNAFYLNLHYNYIALSWQQQSIYVKTGMRIATKSIFE